ncbi:MAG TPA: hypothetical protein VE130_13450 [Nitrososphaeraceae archaeon]|jgi:hypothetical protein|nr:hypothetical protein [Nitrososphaeraceae archaeon]
MWSADISIAWNDRFPNFADADIVDVTGDVNEIEERIRGNDSHTCHQASLQVLPLLSKSKSKECDSVQTSNVRVEDIY